MGVNKMLELITVLYAGVGAIFFIGYLPQIYTLITATGLSKAISLPSWIIWSAGHSIAVLYAIIALGDFVAIAVSFANFMGCALVLMIAVYNRFYRFRNEDIITLHKAKGQPINKKDCQEMESSREGLKD